MNPEEREWLAQEAATRCDRSGSDGHELDTLSASYLSVVRAAGQPIEVQLPADFASRIVALACEHPRAVEIDARFERHLLQFLAVLLGIVGIATAVIYGGNWLVSSMGLIGQIGKSSLTLSMSLLACLGLSALGQQFRRMASSMSGHSA